MLTGGHQGFIGIETTLWHVSGQKHSQTVELPTSARSPQDIGSAITYFKRYALSAALGLSTEEDDDGAAASRSRPEPSESPLAAAKRELWQLLQNNGIAPVEAVERFAAKHGGELKDTQDVAAVEEMIRHYTEITGGSS
jgi:hypothetical protein